MVKIKGVEININRECSHIKQLEECIIRGNRRLALEDAVLLFTACSEINAKNILEIGSADGASTQVLGLAAKENNGKLWAIEPVVKKKLLDNISISKLGNVVNIIYGQSPYVNPYEYNIEIPLDLLFIDGNHKTQWVIGDYYYWKTFVRPGGIIIFHDWCGAGGNKQQIRRAIDIIMETDSKYLDEWGRSEPKDKGAIAYLVKEIIR